MRGNEKYLELTPVKAIRAKCLDCCCGSSNEVELCPCDGVHGALCPLWKYRSGHNPRIKKRELTEEQRQANRERLRKYREHQLRAHSGMSSDDADGFGREITQPKKTD